MRDIRLGHSLNVSWVKESLRAAHKTGRTDESLIISRILALDRATHLELYGLSRESLPNKRRLVDHSLPALSLVFTRLDDFEHLLLGDTPNLGQRHGILGRPILSAVFDSRTKSLGILSSATCLEHSAHLLTLTIKQVRRESALLDRSIVFLLDISLVVRLQRLFHLDLLRVSLGMVKLGLVTKHLLRFLRSSVDLSSGTLSPGV